MEVEESEENKKVDLDEDDSLKAENLPTKAYLRFTMDEDPLYHHEDSRKYSNPSKFNSLGSKAAYIANMDIANMKAVFINTWKQLPSIYQKRESNEVHTEIHITLHKPCMIQKIYP